MELIDRTQHTLVMGLGALQTDGNVQQGLFH